MAHQKIEQRRFPGQQLLRDYSTEIAQLRLELQGEVQSQLVGKQQLIDIAETLWKILEIEILRRDDLSFLDVKNSLELLLKKLADNNYQLTQQDCENSLNFAFLGAFVNLNEVESEAKAKLEQWVKQLYTTDNGQNPFHLKPLSRYEWEIQDAIDVEYSKKIYVSATMSECLHDIKLAKQGVISYRQALYRVQRKGASRLNEHERNSLQYNVYVKASDLQQGFNKYLLVEKICRNYCHCVLKEILTTDWDILNFASVVSHIDERAQISPTMYEMLEFIESTERGLRTYEECVHEITKLAVAAKGRHEQAGKQESRDETRKAPYEFYDDICKAPLLLSGNELANDCLARLKQQMDSLARNESNLFRVGFFSLRIGGVWVDNVANGRQEKVPQNLAKMYRVYADYENNKIQPLAAVMQIHKIANRARMHRSFFRTDETQQAYRQIAAISLN